MCGIAGAVRRGGIAPPVLRDMAHALAHRGPDGEGVAELERFQLLGDLWQPALVHRRLAVFDPSSAGSQPMRSRSGRSVLVLNGEIYNHPELRRRLPGFPWRTGTDTEVLLELFEREGHRILRHLNGMFAFAVWESERRCLTLVRDRLGIKPLFHRTDKDGVVFASELRGLLAGPPFERRVNRGAFSAYLDLGFVPAPLSLLEGVSKLPPASMLEWRRGEVRVRRWWDLPERDAAAAKREAAPDAALRGWREELYARLVEAVRLRLRSDVPVGCFLSGGIDSTLLSALAMRLRGELETFSLALPEYPAFDEAPVSRRTACQLGSRHREYALRVREVEREAPAILSSIDEPLADSSLLAVDALSRAARDRVTVAVSGDGADELFAGYRRYGAAEWIRRWRRLPGGLRRRALEPLLRGLRADRSTRVGELVRRARKVLDAEGLPGGARDFELARIVADGQKRRVAPGLNGHADTGFALFAERRTACGEGDALDRQLRLDLSLGLPDDMLVKVDRASMRHGLEVRVPFLDHRVVEHALRLPSSLKRRDGRGKWALIDVFGAELPRRVVRRPKSGFDAPLTGWLRGPLRSLARDALSARTLDGTGLLDARAVQSLLAEHERGEADHAWCLWSLIVFSDWWSRCGSAGG